MTYKLIAAPSLDQLVYLVNEALRNDWTPTGGPIAIFEHPLNPLERPEHYVIQALIKLGPP